MLIAEDLLLLLTDDASGKTTVDSQRLGLALAGAVLVELVLANRVAVTDDGRWGSGSRVALAGSGPLEDPILAEAIRRIAGRRQPIGAQSLLTMLGKGLPDELRHRLVGRGILRAEEGRVLGIFPTRAWPAADSTHEAAVRKALWDVVVVGRTPTDREVCLVSLLHAVDQVPRQFDTDGMTARQTRSRAKALSEGNVGGKAVRHAVDAANAAVAGAVIAASTAAQPPADDVACKRSACRDTGTVRTAMLKEGPCADGRSWRSWRSVCCSPAARARATAVRTAAVRTAAVPAAPAVPTLLELVNLWRVSDAEGEPTETWLRLDASSYQLWRDCGGFLEGGWAASGTVFVASTPFAVNGDCDRPLANRPVARGHPRLRGGRRRLAASGRRGRGARHPDHRWRAGADPHRGRLLRRSHRT